MIQKKLARNGKQLQSEIKFNALKCQIQMQLPMHDYGYNMIYNEVSKQVGTCTCVLAIATSLFIFLLLKHDSSIAQPTLLKS